MKKIIALLLSDPYVGKGMDSDGEYKITSINIVEASGKVKVS